MCAGPKNQDNSNKSRQVLLGSCCVISYLYFGLLFFSKTSVYWRNVSLYISKAWESQTELCMSPDPELTADVSLGELTSLSLNTFLSELLWVSDEIQSR